MTLPSNAKRAPHAHEHRELVRTDPDYHGPLSREDFLEVRLWVKALVVFFAIVAFVICVSIVDVG